MQTSPLNSFQYSPAGALGASASQCNTAIILAGGLGTRLRSAVPDLPKCMAPINGKPFIGFVIDHFLSEGITKFILSLGYMHEVMIAHVDNAYPHLDVTYSIEDEPLGTGGAIRLACTHAQEENVAVTNGDTLFKVNMGAVIDFHLQHCADCTLSLKPMKDFSRYGVVALNADSSVESFKEKQYYAEGLINGGLYVLNAKQFLQEGLPEKFSFEKDYLEKLYARRKMFGVPQDAYFIDIGIPEDYQRAQVELK